MYQISILLKGGPPKLDVNLFAKLMVAFRPQGIGYSCWKVHVDMQIEYRKVAARRPLTFLLLTPPAAWLTQTSWGESAHGGQ